MPCLSMSGDIVSSIEVSVFLADLDAVDDKVEFEFLDMSQLAVSVKSMQQNVGS